MKPEDRQAMEEQVLRVSRYVAGDLSRSERAEFEAWLVASPELAAEVELERKLRRGMSSAARRGWIKSASSAPMPRQRNWRMAAAASVAGAFLVGGISLMTTTGGERNSTARQSDATPLSLGLPRTVRLASMRGLGTSPDISITHADAPRELNLEPDVVVLTCEDGTIDFECAGGSAPNTPQYSEYKLELVNRADASVAWSSSRQIATADRALSFRVNSPGQLRAGDYDVLVRGYSLDYEEVVARYWLHVTAR